MSYDVPNVGPMIAHHRRQRGYTAAALAREVGISKGYLSQLESGQKFQPAAYLVWRIAAQLGVTVEDLLDVPRLCRLPHVTMVPPDDWRSETAAAESPAEGE